MKRFRLLIPAAASLAMSITPAFSQTTQPIPQTRAADPQLAQSYPAPGGPVVQRGWSCSGCALGSTYCVINLVRYEHVCAPLNSYACAGFSGTAYCAFGTVCLDGTCRDVNLRW